MARANGLPSQRSVRTTRNTEAADQPQAPAKSKAAADTRAADGGEFNKAKKSDLNRAITPAMQKSTLERTRSLALAIAAQGKVPVYVLDLRGTSIDDRPIIRQGFADLVARNNITELRDLDKALKNGTLKELPFYTEQASDAWREEHPELVAKYPNAFGSPGTRIPINFMNYSPSEADPAEGLKLLEASLKGLPGPNGTVIDGEVIFAGQGSGSREDFVGVLRKSGIENPDVRFGGPSLSSAGNAKSEEAIRRYNQAHPNEDPVVNDHDSRAKGGWIEAIEREPAAGGKERVVVAFFDDRAHNRLAAQAASKLGNGLIAVKAAAPGVSFSQNDNQNENQVSTFTPNPKAKAD